MSLIAKIVLIIFGAAYFFSPVDIIPDFLIPFVGWLDDTVVIGIIIYLIRFGRLPYFSGKNGKIFNSFANIFNTYNSQSANTKQTDTNKKTKRKDPFEVLGINKNATKKEIQAAYKHKVKQYHPDKVSHLGEELQKVANEKFIEIKNAYDHLMKYS